MEGWIKIHRKFDKWEWRDKPEMVSLFLHMLTQANYERSSWHGIVIERGQCIFGRKKWAEILGISERTIRSSLSNLISTSEVTIKTTNKYSIVTIVKYEDYQLNEEEATSKATSKTTSNRPATDQQPTTPKERKELKKEKNTTPTPSPEKPKTELELKFEEFAAHRISIKKPMSPQARKLLRNKINGFIDAGFDVIDMMDTAIEHGWQTIYPPKDDVA